ncbi:DUF3306 domain-containing protein [Pacificoceanicola onchidii]|uniref:DUF3306 domain-containing protein n=1 Tax=Pacificoceanicola onchidii TaxID=2562685 RepID=UPI0010A569D3|nr:DUF3306 domain-containing protein [Pacificoceanicola onchidii]
MSRGGDFWSRRKAAVADEQRADVLAEEAVQEAAREAALEEQSDEALLAEHGLPEPEQLDSAEAVREFLQSALPQRLKTRALRRLWGLNPVLANLDGLVDYGEDFTDAATVVENMQTVYQVGKGMFDKFADLEEDTEEASETEEGEETEELDLLVSAVRPPEPAPIPTIAPAPIPEFAMDEEPDPLPASSRRMQFRFAT